MVGKNPASNAVDCRLLVLMLNYGHFLVVQNIGLEVNNLNLPISCFIEDFI